MQGSGPSTAHDEVQRLELEKLRLETALRDLEGGSAVQWDSECPDNPLASGCM